jgi:hypothetical protein
MRNHYQFGVVIFKWLFILFLAASPKSSVAQEDFGWWVEKHNWDGVTPWNQYLTISSAFLGPNALPVPEVRNGRVDSAASLQVSFGFHTSRGDETQDMYLRGALPLFANRMSVEMDVVPLEWYEMDTITRDVRAVRTRSGKGSAGGDIYLTTAIQVFRDRPSLPDMLLRFTMRTASGTHLRDARYTDAPGYFADLSFGKSIRNDGGFVNEIRMYADAGLYTYQTYDLRNLQNDCLFYGGGVTLSSGRVALTNHLAGYSGYIRNGDQPLVYRSEIRMLNRVIDWSFGYQWGLHDYAYQRFRISCILHIESEKIFDSDR